MDKVCAAGDRFVTRGAADDCAEKLSSETGKKHEVKTESENVSDGLPAVVMQTFYKVIEGRAEKK